MAKPAKNHGTDSPPDERDDWAATEFATVQLGDARRSKRLVHLVTTMANRPGTSIPNACGGWAETKAAYRFLSNDAIDPDAVLDAHRHATMQRVGEHDVVLAVQDTTYFTFATHPATEGLGPIGEQGTLGLIAHTCLAVSPAGVPLGVLGQHTWARPPNPKRRTEKQRRTAPIRDKESQRWLDMLETSAQGLPREVGVVAVADREADIFEFLDHAVHLGQDVLVRSCYDRATEDGYAWERADNAPLAGTMCVEIPRSGNRPARTAVLELRSATVEVKKPDPRCHRRPGPTVPLTMLVASEREAPEGVEPVCWRLLTSLPADTFEDLERCVEWYALRWRIERFFYTLKSGCRMEDLQLKARDRIERALCVLSVVAWRLLALTHQARETPEASCEGFLSRAEWRLAHCVVHRTRTPPAEPPSLREGVRLIARLGGFLARTGDGEPGVKVLWRGFARLHDLVLASEFGVGLEGGSTCG